MVGSLLWNTGAWGSSISSETEWQCFEHVIFHALFMDFVLWVLIQAFVWLALMVLWALFLFFGCLLLMPPLLPRKKEVSWCVCCALHLSRAAWCRSAVCRPHPLLVVSITGCSLRLCTTSCFKLIVYGFLWGSRYKTSFSALCIVRMVRRNRGASRVKARFIFCNLLHQEAQPWRKSFPLDGKEGN